MKNYAVTMTRTAPQQKSLCKKLRDSLMITTDVSSLHGMPNITALLKTEPISVCQRYSLFFIWLTSILISYSVCASFMLASFFDYFNYDVVTSIEIDYLTKITFPVISICNFDNNRFSRNASSSSPRQMIWSCAYNLKECDYDNDFEFYLDVNYGACFRYNSGLNGSTSSMKFMKGKGYGSMNTLVLLVYVGSVYDVYKGSTVSPLNSARNGLKLYITNESTDSTRASGLNIQTGVSAFISLNKQTTRLSPRPYTKCVSDLTSLDAYDSECFRRTFESFAKSNYTRGIISYHFLDCYTMCIQKLIGEMCQCQSRMGPLYYKGMRQCNDFNKTDLACQLNSYDILTDDYLDKCDCPLECEQTLYAYSLSYADFLTKTYADYMYSQNISNLRSIYPEWNLTTYEHLRASVAELRIFYDEMREIIISQNIKTRLADFIAILGGIIGLFSGFSFLTLVEFVEAIFNVIFICYRHSVRVTAFNDG